jgi:phosphoglycolate phosphatase
VPGPAAIANVVFDLDGTLVDSRPGIERAARRAVAEVLPGRDPVPLAPLIGPPIATMLARAYPDVGEEQHAALVAAFRRAYDGGDWRETVAFDGLHDVLDAFAAARRRLFVVTNKPATPTRQILEHLGVWDRFEAVLSPDSEALRWRGKHVALGHLTQAFKVLAEWSIYVGDDAEDRSAARLAGLRFVAATYGYGTAGITSSDEDLAAIDRLSELVPLVIDEDENEP